MGREGVEKEEKAVLTGPTPSCVSRGLLALWLLGRWGRGEAQVGDPRAGGEGVCSAVRPAPPPAGSRQHLLSLPCPPFCAWSFSVCSQVSLGVALWGPDTQSTPRPDA